MLRERERELSTAMSQTAKQHNRRAKAKLRELQTYDLKQVVQEIPEALF